MESQDFLAAVIEAVVENQGARNAAPLAPPSRTVTHSYRDRRISRT